MIGYIYLASPYTGSDGLKEYRFRAALDACARLMLAGKVVYSPIAHSHMIEKLAMGVVQTHHFWMEQCFPMLATASEMYVLQIEGWNRSNGIQLEMEFARERGIPISFILP